MTNQMRSGGLAAGGVEHRPAPRLLDFASLAAFAVLWLALGGALATARPAAGGAGLALLALPIGYVLADFASGVVHWACDRFFAEDTPLIGGAIIRPFREHHTDPLALTRHGLLELSGNNGLACLPVLAAGLAARAHWPGDGVVYFANTVVLWLTLALLISNHIHKWAHLEQTPAAVSWLQQHHLILSPAQHARHHGAGHDRAYCITTGWLNPALDRIGFFARIERLLRAGEQPRRRDVYPRRRGRR